MNVLISNTENTFKRIDRKCSCFLTTLTVTLRYTKLKLKNSSTAVGFDAIFPTISYLVVRCVYFYVNLILNLSISNLKCVQ